MKLYHITIVLLFISLLAAPGTYAYGDTGVDVSPVVEERTITSSQNIIFNIKLNLSTYVVSIRAKNKGDYVVETVLNLKIDGKYSKSTKVTLSPTEVWTHKSNIRESIKINKENHYVIISTYGNNTKINFDDGIKSSSQTTIPNPKITDITIKNGTIDGNASSVAKVTVENPSIHTYPTKLMVHTQETDGSFYGASVPPGESRTFTVELLDERGARTAGEARLYTGNLTTADGAMDQVEFVGEADADTSQWNATYEPVNPPWMEGQYQYENESLDEPTWAERVSNGYAIGGVPAVYVGLGSLAVALLGGVTRRLL